MDKTQKLPNQYRSLTLTQPKIDEESRTVELAFSSEIEVERWYGIEVLDHKPESVRLDRLNNGGALLADHDDRTQIGKVESATIDADGKGRATVRFSKNARAQQEFDDVKDGIRTLVSVRYMIHKYEVEKRGDVEIYRATDWEPTEISFVAVPADASVGVGRSNETEHPFILERKNMTTETVEKTEEVKTEQRQAPKAPVVEVNENHEKNAQERVQSMMAVGRKYGQVDLAARAIEEGKSKQELQEMILDTRADASSENATEPASNIGLTQKETQRFSMINAIRAASTGNWKGAEFELEASRAVAEKVGKDARGFFVPGEVMMDSSFASSQRAVQNTGVAAEGGALVGTDHASGSFIELLRETSVISSLGATQLPGLVENVDIPRQEGASSFYWLDEDEDTTESDINLGTVSLRPKTIAGAVAMTRRLLKQSTPSIENLIRQDLITGAGLAIDQAAINGDGQNNTPLGILNQTGVHVVNHGGTIDWGTIVDLEAIIDDSSALAGNLSYLTTPGVKGALKKTEKAEGTAQFIWDGNGMNGYNATRTKHMPADTLLFGNFRDVLIGWWGVLDVVPDTAKKAASGGLVVRVFQDLDIAVRHGQSFAKAVA